MLSVPGKGEEKQDCLLHRVRQVYPTVLVVHRLDWETSGLVVFALTAHCQRALNLQFEKRQVQKEYLAVIQDSPKPESSGVVSHSLRPDLENRPLQVVDDSEGKDAVTRWEVLERLKPDGTLVRLMPETGRTHQLRVHMRALGTPILGDSLYADKAEREAADRLLLHADSITLNCPASLARLRFWSLSVLGRGGATKRSCACFSAAHPAARTALRAACVAALV